jgi:hypothetical protein
MLFSLHSHHPHAALSFTIHRNSYVNPITPFTSDWPCCRGPTCPPYSPMPRAIHWRTGRGPHRGALPAEGAEPRGAGACVRPHCLLCMRHSWFGADRRVQSNVDAIASPRLGSRDKNLSHSHFSPIHLNIATLISNNVITNIPPLLRHCTGRGDVASAWVSGLAPCPHGTDLKLNNAAAEKRQKK